MIKIWKLVIILAAVYAAICAAVYYMQSSLIFYPNIPGRTIMATPENINLSYQDVSFYTEDNIKLHGWFIPNENAKATLLFFHGNAGNISHRLDSIKIFHDLGLNVFIIDYRGYGQSAGEITENGFYRDAEAAWNYLVDVRDIREEDVIIFGRSLGASVASWLASNKSPAALIVESAFTSVPAMGQRLYPFLPVRWLSRFQFDTLQHIKNVSSPVLVAHSQNDEIIPYSEGRKIFEAANEPKQFLEMSGGHNDGFIISGTAYTDGIELFIRKSLL